MPALYHYRLMIDREREARALEMRRRVLEVELERKLREGLLERNLEERERIEQRIRGRLQLEEALLEKNLQEREMYVRMILRAKFLKHPTPSTGTCGQTS